MLAISPATLMWSCATLVYIVLVGGVLLTQFAKIDNMRVARPWLSILQVAGISGIVFLMASVPSYVARVVNPDILPFIMPYAAALFAVSFIVFILKLQSKRSGWHQMAVALLMAALMTAALIAAQYVLRAVL